jgi:hypothetical protein
VPGFVKSAWVPVRSPFIKIARQRNTLDLFS